MKLLWNNKQFSRSFPEYCQEALSENQQALRNTKALSCVFQWNAFGRIPIECVRAYVIQWNASCEFHLNAFNCCVLNALNCQLASYELHWNAFNCCMINALNCQLYAFMHY